MMLRRSDFDPAYLNILNRQLQIVMLFVLAIFSILILRLWYLQVVGGNVYRCKSENNRIHLIDIAPFRGMIFDRNGNRLVGNRPSYDLFIIPEGVQDSDQLVMSLKRLIGLEERHVKQKLKEVSPAHPFRPVCIKKDLLRNELAVIETHRYNLPGVMIKVRPQRHYINKTH